MRLNEYELCFNFFADAGIGKEPQSQGRLKGEIMLFNFCFHAVSHQLTQDSVTVPLSIKWWGDVAMMPTYPCLKNDGRHVL